MRGMKALHRRTWLRLALDQPLLVLAIAGMLLAGALVLYPMMGKDFLPALQRRQRDDLARVSAPGTSLEQTNEIGEVGVRLLQSIPEVKSVGRRAGPRRARRSRDAGLGERVRRRVSREGPARARRSSRRSARSSAKSPAPFAMSASRSAIGSAHAQRRVGAGRGEDLRSRSRPTPRLGQTGRRHREEHSRL